jgi:hypothetical protein
MPRPADTRLELRRALVVNALTKPVNVLVPTAVVVAAGLLGASWLGLVALVCWLGLAAVTFFDEEEAKRVGARRRAAPLAAAGPRRTDPAALSEEIGSRLAAAVEAQESIRAAIEASDLPLDDVLEEVDALVAAMDAHAQRAQRIHAFLAERSPRGLEARIAGERSPAVVAALEAQLAAVTRLRQRQRELLAEMDHVVASLDTVHAEVLTAEGLDEAMGRRAVASQVVELRTNVQLVSAGLEEAFEETRARLPG